MFETMPDAQTFADQVPVHIDDAETIVAICAVDDSVEELQWINFCAGWLHQGSGVDELIRLLPDRIVQGLNDDQG